MLSWEYARLEADDTQKHVIFIISLCARKEKYVSYFFLGVKEKTAKQWWHDKLKGWSYSYNFEANFYIMKCPV